MPAPGGGRAPPRVAPGPAGKAPRRDGGGLQITRETRSATLVVRVAGDLDVRTADAFREQVDDWFLASDHRRLVLNLSRVAFLDSTGLGALLGRLRRVRAAGREMVLVPPAGVARAVLDVAALGRVVPIFRSERAALSEEAEAHA